MKMAGFFERLASEKAGATMVEYALLIGMITAALVVAVNSFSNSIGGLFTSATNAFGGS